MKKNKLVSFIAALACLAPSVVLGQLFTYNVQGIVNPGDQNIIGQLSATVQVEFQVSGQAKVTVTNTGPANSSITGFYLMRPTAIGGVPTTLNGFAAAPSSDPSDWALETSLSETLKNFGGNWDTTKYFGADAGTRLDFPDVAGSSVGTFYFDFDPFLLDVAAYQNPGMPSVFVRWQAVDLGGNLTDESGKGYGGPGFEPAIPEPSHVAGLAMLGLAGILYTRRRLTKKK
jgi:hypothetical protein